MHPDFQVDVLVKGTSNLVDILWMNFSSTSDMTSVSRKQICYRTRHCTQCTAQYHTRHHTVPQVTLHNTTQHSTAHHQHSTASEMRGEKPAALICFALFTTFLMPLRIITNERRRKRIFLRPDQRLWAIKGKCSLNKLWDYLGIFPNMGVLSIQKLLFS